MKCSTAKCLAIAGRDADRSSIAMCDVLRPPRNRASRGARFVMTLEQLRIFVAVAERLNMTRAAEALDITQSAVSGAVAALENQHQVSLPSCRARIELTDAGAMFLDEARHSRPCRRSASCPG
jgi:DNA-binding MarR family transcriptional regulator